MLLFCMIHHYYGFINLSPLALSCEITHTNEQIILNRVLTDMNANLRTPERDLPWKANARLVVTGFRDLTNSHGELWNDVPTGSRLSTCSLALERFIAVSLLQRLHCQWALHWSLMCAWPSWTPNRESWAGFWRGWSKSCSNPPPGCRWDVKNLWTITVSNCSPHPVRGSFQPLIFKITIQNHGNRVIIHIHQSLPSLVKDRLLNQSCVIGIITIYCCCSSSSSSILTIKPLLFHQS